MKYYKYIRIILILIPVAILGALVYLDVCPSGTLKVDYDFCREDAFVSKFSPMGRVLEIEKTDEYCQQTMVIDPVYFDVRLPQSFRKAYLKIWYKKDEDTELKIGPRFNDNQWLWNFQDIKKTGEDNGWQTGEADYDLSYVSMDNNRIRFLISSPGLDVLGKEIIFKKIEIIFKKEPMGRDNFLQRLKSAYERIF